MNDITAFRDELRKLCKGRGLLSPDFLIRLGPQLSQRMRESGMTEDELGQRGQVSAWFSDRLTRLPDDLSLVGRVAFGLHPAARHRFLGERVQWLASAVERDERTVRRRIDEAISLLIDCLADEETNPDERAQSSSGRPAGWYYGSVRSVVRLDLPEPEVLEERRITATISNLETMVIEVSLPPGKDLDDPRDLFAEVVFGGLLTSRARPSTSHFRFNIALPRRLAKGEQHDVAIRYSFPPGHQMVPHYTLVPLARCDRFQLRLRASPRFGPHRVWLVDGVPPRAVDDPPTPVPTIFDAAYEAIAEFTELELGHAYGLRWEY
jgi:hypothetical protein